jgi:hypothetical protein
LGEGWQIGSVVTALSGRPWTPVLGNLSDESGQDLVYNRPNCSGVKPAYQFSDPRNPTITNIDAIFTIPDPNTLGTCGRNSLRGPHFRQWDFNLNKTTKLTERMSLQIRFEVFNLLNHPNFNSSPSSARVTSSSFSKYGNTPDIFSGNPFLSQGGARAAQIGAKIIF